MGHAPKSTQFSRTRFWLQIGVSNSSFHAVFTHTFWASFWGAFWTPFRATFWVPFWTHVGHMLDTFCTQFSHTHFEPHFGIP